MGNFKRYISNMTYNRLLNRNPLSKDAFEPLFTWIKEIDIIAIKSEYEILFLWIQSEKNV